MNYCKIKKKTLFRLIFIIIILISLFFLYSRSGFFNSYNSIDSRDLEHWDYNSNNLIKGTEAFEINGATDTCWLLIHSYTSTPIEMKEISKAITNEFNEHIIVPKLKGHGEVPSKILNLSLDDWFLQIQQEYDKLALKCNKINVLGSSYGGAIALQLAEKNNKDTKFNNLYIVNGFLGNNYEPYHVFNTDIYIKLFGNYLKFIKKKQIAQINSAEARDKHIAYWNMPLITVKNSQKFIIKTKNNLDKITIPIFILHSHNDKTAWYKWADKIYDEVNSTKKKINYYDNSNHLLLLDYDKETVINDIINREIELRNVN